MKILYLTNYLPIYNSPNIGAGLNITLDNIKKLNLAGNIVDVCALVNNHELEKIEEKKNQYVNQFNIFKITKTRKLVNAICNIRLPIFCAIRYDRRIKEYLEKNSKKYDLVLIDYTQNIEYAEDIKVKKYIIEHDVSFLGFYRKYKLESNFLKKIFYRIEAKRLEKYEKKKLNKFDKVIVLNQKDKKLIENSVKNIQIISPYYNKYNISLKKHEGINIGFFGAMNRVENEEAVIFFIEKIYPKLDKKIIKKIYIIGANPSEKLKKYASEKILITGFVEKPEIFLEKLDIGIVPLLKGAGIKIKTLEMLYAGIPLISSEVGVEGIEIVNKKEGYIYKNNEEFVEYLNILVTSEAERINISKNQKQFMELFNKQTLEIQDI
ncbi:MAG: glycosyltransferase [Cetobacterium sp.]